MLCACPTPIWSIQVPEDPADRLRPVIRPADFAATLSANDRMSSLALPACGSSSTARLKFYPGQFLEFEVPGQPGEWRSYSMASSPSRDDEIDLVILKIPGRARSRDTSTMLSRGNAASRSRTRTARAISAREMSPSCSSAADRESLRCCRSSKRPPKTETPARSRSTTAPGRWPTFLYRKRSPTCRGAFRTSATGRRFPSRPPTADGRARSA